MRRKIQILALAAATAVFTVPMFAGTNQSLSDQVRHQLDTVPYYTAFDSINYSVSPDGVVTLNGAVTQPWKKSDADHAVKRIPGVTQVVDNIKVLPLSPMDNQIRRAEYRAIYGFPGLDKYGVGINRSIRIIVDNGHVTLEGTVNNQADKNLAYVRANGVPNVFSVTNDLHVASGG